MLEMSPEAQAVIRRSWTMHVRAEVWYGGDLLTDEVPVDGGSEEQDITLNIPERVSLTVPAVVDGRSWEPFEEQSPLAANGQQIRVDLGVELRGGDVEWLNRGYTLITSSSSDGRSVSVQAQGLLTLIEEARLIVPFEPTGTIKSTIRDLIEPALGTRWHGLLTDRDVPKGMQWDDDRIGALMEVLDAWPADAAVDTDGLLQVFPPPNERDGDPVWEFSDGRDGTVVEWASSSSRDGAFNVVVAEGEDADGNRITGTVYDTDSLSPQRLGSPFSPMPIPHRYSSPLLETVAQCRAGAAATLKRLRRGSGRQITITCVPHPGLEKGDIVAVTAPSLGLDQARVVVDRFTLPYAPAEMQIAARLVL